jgi:hypothetical protein
MMIDEQRKFFQKISLAQGGRQPSCSASAGKKDAAAAELACAAGHWQV